MELNDQQYNLYMQIARKYAANLPDEKDRIKAFKWLKKIHTADAKASKTKNHALNILIICLQRKRLVGPFKIGPKEDKALTAYGWAYQPADIAKLILQQEFEKDGRPPISIEVSGNVCEFVAYQDIPDFGAHFFYAYSPEHIRKWDNLDKAVIPRGLLNVTVVSSPDTSILARSLEKKQKPEEEYVCPGQDPEKPKPCPAKPKEEGKGKGPAKPAAKPGTKPRRIIKKRVVAKMPPLDTSRIEGPMNWVESREEYDARIKQEQMAKMPARLRQRLKKKPAAEDIIEEEGPCEPVVPPPPCGPPPAAPEAPREPESPEMPGVVRTPELFYNKPRGPRKEYKMDEFLLDQDEQFAPATDVFRDLEYEPPPPCEARRRSPVERRQPEMTPVREPPCPQPRSREVAESFERSYQAMMAKREPQPPPPGLTPKHQAIWERLQKLKQAQLQPPRRLVFDEAEISVDQDNVSYERMVYTEFPDEDKPPSILDDTAMGYSDVFGDSRIAAVDVLPAPAQADLDKAELLLEQEMETDEHFGKSKLADPDVVFEDIAVEKEGDGPCAKKVKVGRRKLDVHGEEPLVESYMEESNQPLFDDTLKDDGDYTPPMTDSVLNVILDKKLKELQPTPPSPPCLPPVYGEWAKEFLRGAERIERDEDVEQLSDISAPQYYSSDLETSAPATDPWERARRAERRPPPPGHLSTIAEVCSPEVTGRAPASPDVCQPLYVPTAREQYEMQQEEKMREAMQAAIDLLIYQGAAPCPEPPASPKSRPSPICVPELSPSQMGFKWMENFIPMEHNFPRPPTPPAPPKSQAASRAGAPGQRPCPAGRRPGAPGARPGAPGARPGAPGARPGAPCPRPGAPGARPGAPGTRPGAPGARPGAPGTRPGAPCPRPGAPGARPGTTGARPGTRPGAPCPRPGARPGVPGARPGAPSRQAGPAARQAGPSAAKPCPSTSKISKKLAESATRLSQMKKPPQKETTRPPPSPPKKISQAKLRESLARLTKQPKSKAPPKLPVRPSRPPPGKAPPGQQAGPSARRAGPSGAPGQRPCPPGRQAGPSARKPGPPGAPGQRPCPPGRQAGPTARKPGPPGAPGQRPCPPGRQAGSAAQRPGAPGQRPGAPGQRPGAPGQRPGPPGQRSGPPGQRPCPPSRQAGPSGQPSRRAPPAAARSPDSPYEVKRLPGVQDVVEGGPVPIVTVRKAADVQGPRIYMPPEAMIEREKRMAAMRAAGRKYHRPATTPVCPPPQTPIAATPSQPMGPPRAVQPLRKPTARGVCPRGPAPQPTPARPPPQLAPVAPSKGPCPVREISAPARPTAPRQAPRTAPPMMPETPCRPLPPSVPLPLTGPIQNVLEGGPVPIVTTRNAPDVPMTGPRIYMPAEAIMERRKRLGAGPKGLTEKKSVSVTTLTSGRTAVVKKTSLEIVGGAKGGPSRPSRQDRGRRR